MNLSCQQSDLKSAISTVSRAIQAKSPLPITQNVLMVTEDSMLKLAATNLELGIVRWISAKIKTEGAITVPSRLLTEAVGNLPNEMIDVETDGNNLVLKCGKTRTKITGLDAEDFPPIPIEASEITATIEGSVLRKALTQASIAASEDDTRPVLIAVYVKLENDKATFVSADGFRLAIRTAPLISGPIEPIELLVPAKYAAELNRIIVDEPVEIFVLANHNRVIFKQSRIAVTTSLIAGAYPDYPRLIPQSFATKVNIDTDKFRQAVKACSIFYAHDKSGASNQIRLRVLPGDGMARLNVSAKGDETGDNESEIDVMLDGELGRIGLNGPYIRSVLDIADTGQVSLQINGQNRPGMIRMVGDDDFMYVIMPMLLQWED